MTGSGRLPFTLQCVRMERRTPLYSHSSDEGYYPLGLEDTDYTVLYFEAQRGNYYHRLKNITFDID